MKFLDIGNVAKKSNLKPSALRHYEAAGLIEPVFRFGLRRQFASDVLLQLKLISMCKIAGFSLAEIAKILGRSGMPEPPRDLLHQKANAIDQKIRELKALRDTIRHVADCPAESHLECPTFRRLVEISHKRRTKQNHSRHSRPAINS